MIHYFIAVDPGTGAQIGPAINAGIGDTNGAAFDGQFIWVADGATQEILQIDVGKVVVAPCTLDLNLSYPGGIFTMDFTVGPNGGPTTWNVWLAIANNVIPVLSVPLPALPGAFPIPIAFPLPSFGGVGVLSTLTTPAGGIECSVWATVDTGSVPVGVTIPSAEELQGLFGR